MGRLASEILGDGGFRCSGLIASDVDFYAALRLRFRVSDLSFRVQGSSLAVLKELRSGNQP